MARLGRKRISKFSAAIVTAFILAIAILIWGYTRPLPQYLVAKSQLTYGAPLEMQNLTAVGMDLGDAAALYLTPAEVLEGQVISRFIGIGELVPKSSITKELLRGLSLVNLTPSEIPSSQIAPGSIVKVWTVPKLQGQQYAPASLLTQAEVVSVTQPEGLFAEEAGSYELLIPQESLSLVLEAIAMEHSIYLVVGGM